MSIKEIIINNFKSYKSVHLKDLSKGINLIIGRNGHGKSNLFNGIYY
jgi:AAA15 family ATPase/GTPase